MFEDFDFGDYGDFYLTPEYYSGGAEDYSWLYPDASNNVVDFSSLLYPEASFDVGDLYLTPSAEEAGGFYGTGATDFMNLSDLLKPSLAQTELISTNPFAESGDSWLSTGLDYLNPEMDRIENILGVYRGDTPFADAAQEMNSVQDYMTLENLLYPNKSWTSASRGASDVAQRAAAQAAQQRAAAAAAGANKGVTAQDALRAAQLAATLYGLATGSNGIDRSTLERNDAVRNIGPSFERAQAIRGGLSSLANK